MKKIIKVQQDEDIPITKEILATAIVKISASFEALLKSGINRKAIVVLLHDSTKISKTDINYVLDGLIELKKDYCN